MSKTVKNEALLKVQNIKKRFGQNEILRGVSLAVNKGEVAVILGPSGSGKTTLLRTINFLDKADSGIVSLGGVRIDSSKPSKKSVLELTKKTAFVFQNYNLFSNMTVLENVMAGLTIARHVNKKDAEKIAREALDWVNLSDRLDYYPSKLSGGQQQRAGIARAIALNPDIILFDEPTSALDPIAESRIYEEYNHMASSKTAVFISHRLASTKFCDRILFLDGGQIVEEGSHDELMKNGGKYREIFDIQSHYYKEQGTGNSK